MRAGEIKELQEKRLGALIKHAYENVPDYHKIFEKNGLKPQDKLYYNGGFNVWYVHASK